MLGQPALGRARLADQQERPVGDERGDRDLDQPLVAQVLGRDVVPAGLAAADVGVDGAGRHVPAGRLLVLIGRGQRFELAGEQDLGRHAQDIREGCRCAAFDGRFFFLRHVRDSFEFIFQDEHRVH